MRVIFLLSLLTIISCDSSTTKTDFTITAVDKDLQFGVKKSNPYTLIMTRSNEDSIILEIPDLDCKPIDFFKEGKRYFFSCIDNNDEKTIWEIEEDLGRVMQLDLSEIDLKDFEKLKK